MFTLDYSHVVAGLIKKMKTQNNGKKTLKKKLKSDEIAKEIHLIWRLETNIFFSS